MVVVVEVIEDDTVTSEVVGDHTVVEVISTTDTPKDVTSVVDVVEVVREGGAVTNVLWGYGMPSNPTVGMIWIDVS